MSQASKLKIAIYTDGANKDDMLKSYKLPYVKGFTTNPTLMKQAGIKDYVAFAKDILKAIPDRSISFEVFADDFPSMKVQAMKIKSWGENVFVKIPITNTKGESAAGLIKELASSGVKLNVTALLTTEQVKLTHECLNPNVEAIISIFAGRIADTGRDPMPIMKEASKLVAKTPKLKTLWASSREVLNIFQAEEAGTDIITVTPAIVSKLDKLGMDLTALSLDTVKMFYNDATSAGFSIS